MRQTPKPSGLKCFLFLSIVLKWSLIEGPILSVLRISWGLSFKHTQYCLKLLLQLTSLIWV
uniref:Uncharacterized protein n=1 Tax=Anguilla anguilla TaxID=7936 RepID=A0A0E9WGI1_ANGAN